MNAEEKATLRDLIGMVGELRDDVMDRFDGFDVRMRSMEQELAARRAADEVRKDQRATIRWSVSSFLTVIAISASVAGIVVRLLS